MFVTDAMFVPVKFANVRHWIIEANYSDAILEQRIETGQLDPSQAKRVRWTHLSVENAADAILLSGTEQLESVTLVHLSNGNSDEKKFKQIIEQQAGVPCNVADAGVVVEL